MSKTQKIVSTGVIAGLAVLLPVNLAFASHFRPRIDHIISSAGISGSANVINSGNSTVVQGGQQQGQTLSGNVTQTQNTTPVVPASPVTTVVPVVATANTGSGISGSANVINSGNSTVVQGGQQQAQTGNGNITQTSTTGTLPAGQSTGSGTSTVTQGGQQQAQTLKGDITQNQSTQVAQATQSVKTQVAQTQKQTVTAKQLPKAGAESATALASTVMTALGVAYRRLKAEQALLREIVS